MARIGRGPVQRGRIGERAVGVERRREESVDGLRSGRQQPLELHAQRLVVTAGLIDEGGSRLAFVGEGFVEQLEGASLGVQGNSVRVAVQASRVVISWECG